LIFFYQANAQRDKYVASPIEKKNLAMFDSAKKLQPITRDCLLLLSGLVMRKKHSGFLNFYEVLPWTTPGWQDTNWIKDAKC
jgi:hypothetical protein